MKMKIVVGVLVVIAGVGLVSQVYFLMLQKNIEEYRYNVIKKYQSFEVRQYETSLFTSIKLPTKNFKKASSKGFSILAGYIFGDNKKNEKIAMTSPVTMSLQDSTTMMFLVPKKYAKENLPVPNNATIQFKEVPSKKMAAITFGGWANDVKIENYKQKLISALAQENIQYKNKFYFFGYNAPLELFNRKNEVLVELE